MSDSVKKPKVLFVCAGNTCRSVLAEYIARKKFRQIAEFSSAGLEPGTIEDTENAIYTIKRSFDGDASDHRPRDVKTLDVSAFELVVAMDNQIAKGVQTIFPNFPVDRLVKWRIKDPYGDDLGEYEQCAFTINAELKKLPILKGKG